MRVEAGRSPQANLGRGDKLVAALLRGITSGIEKVASDHASGQADSYARLSPAANKRVLQRRIYIRPVVIGLSLM